MRTSTLSSFAALQVVASSLYIQPRVVSLSDVCTSSYVQAALPADGTLNGTTINASSLQVNAVTNSSTSSGPGGMGGGGASTANYPYCNVTFSYTHSDRSDEVVVRYALPQPSDFQDRFYVAGGGGYELSSSATGGLEYGAAGGITDAGYDAFEYSLDEVVLLSNGSLNWDAINAFSYEALGEMTVLGKALTQNFYSLNTSKVYTYFEGCSDGGRQAMSQVQRWGEEYDGVVAGAPAFRQAQQQVNHVFSSMVEQTQGYFPPPCALAKIVNLTITACDPLDGRSDGVVARTDLCMLQFNLSSTIGESYYCAAETAVSQGFGKANSTGPTKRQAPAGASTSSYQPAQNGTVTAQDVAVAQTIYDGLHNSEGQRAYLSWQIASSFVDAATVWSNASNSWVLSIPSTGGAFVTKFVEIVNATNLSTLDGDDYDTLVTWMTTAYYRYLDSLQTTVPDLSPFQQSGGKLLHYHGESDNSVPTASSVHYYQSVRSVMYNDSSLYNISSDMEPWYQLYLVPGAAHCGVNTLQPGPYPYDNMNIMVDWVENGVMPSRLNATVDSGEYKGETQFLCQWPTRPLWSNSTSFDCVVDEESVDSWTYTFPAFNTTIY